MAGATERIAPNTRKGAINAQASVEPRVRHRAEAAISKIKAPVPSSASAERPRRREWSGSRVTAPRWAVTTVSGCPGGARPWGSRSPGRLPASQEGELAERQQGGGDVQGDGRSSVAHDRRGIAILQVVQ